MTNEINKLSPADFLAELKSQGGEGTTVHLATSTDTADSLDDLGLDFSDLDAPDPQGEEDAIASVGIAAEPEAEDESKEPEFRETKPLVVTNNKQLSSLFDRVNDLLGNSERDEDEPFRPEVPESLEETRLTAEEIERLILKFLFSKGSGTGRQICNQLKLPFGIVDPIMKDLKQEQLVMFKNAVEMGDYDFAITDIGRERARRYSQECTYFGAAPVSLPDYLEAMAAQSIAKQTATEADLKEAFSDLIIDEKMLDRLGPAVNSGRGMFLFGEPGNGKTSIAERITKAFGSTIWIPRTLGIDGDIIRLFDPGVHEEVEEVNEDGSIFDFSGVDQRWVHIVRPTVIAGGELTMDALEVIQNNQTKICEAPLQLKSNCGTLVIDDFGRQRMPVDELLNRWIVPLEKRYDFLNLPSGKKIQVPFDQLIIFSTNLEPKDLVDGAFLRRIPYKIEALDPTEEQFRELLELMAPICGFEHCKKSTDHLIEEHYKKANRPFRACQPRDLLLQVKNYCVYKDIPKEITPEAFDFAVENYFSVM